MRPVLTSFGTNGDVQPFLALAVQLRARGHNPILALSPHFTSRARELNLECVPIGPELEVQAIRRVEAAQMKHTAPGEQVRDFLTAVAPLVPQMFRELTEICRDGDVLISSPFQLAGRMVHETINIPLVSVHLSPFGALGVTETRNLSAPLINQCRLQAGLKALGDPFGADSTSPQLALYGVSRHILRPRSDWPANHHVVGFLFLNEEEWEPDAGLSEFIAAGDKPVVVSFGSVLYENSAALAELVVEAITQARCRAIIQDGWSRLGQRQLPAKVYATGFVPHRWLFEKAACVVHHGGAGTVAAAFRAGVPSVIVPHMLDQPIWAEFARALGCAGAVLPFAQLTVNKLSHAIAETLATPRFHLSAQAFAKLVREEQGTQNACDLIEQMVC